ncbi:hypothetical protein ABLM79_004573 [Escherichia albertii]
MFSNVNVDCCKTLGFKNLGVLNSVDYVAQGKNILCQECGYLFPVISERSLNLYRNIVNHSWRGVIQQCPACGSTSLKNMVIQHRASKECIVIIAIKHLLVWNI